MLRKLEPELRLLFKKIAVKTKHGPGGSGTRGPCDADCVKCQVEQLLKEDEECPTPYV